MTMCINEPTHSKQETKQELKQDIKEKRKNKQMEGEEMFIKKRKIEMCRNRSIVAEEKKLIVEEVRSKTKCEKSVQEIEMKR